jgi:hypothetical protein
MVTQIFFEKGVSVRRRQILSQLAVVAHPIINNDNVPAKNQFEYR